MATSRPLPAKAPSPTQSAPAILPVDQPLSAVLPVAGRKRAHDEIAMLADADDSNDSIEWTLPATVIRPVLTSTTGTISYTNTNANANANNNNNNNNGGFLDTPPANHIGPAPFSHEPLADQRRSEVDYTTRYSEEDAKAGRVSRPVRVYADGIYDMFHTGHARQLMQAKMAFPHTYLIVGVCSDEMTFRKKGRTVMNEAERYEALRHCRYVDEVLTDAPWSTDFEFLEANKIDFVAHDDLPYTMGSSGSDVYKDVKEKGMFVATQRTEGVSTTDVITRIIKDYDLYVRRNLARGYSHKELNVSYVKAKHLKFKDNYEKLETKLKDKGKNLMGKWKEQVGKYDHIIHRWEEKSKEFIGSFVDMFSKDGRLGQWLQESTTRIGRAISPTQLEQEGGGGEGGAHAMTFDFPSSPTTSDFDSSSPPHKKGRFSPLFMLHGEEDDEDEEEGEGEELTYKEGED